MHALDITDGQTSFVSAHTAAWHQLGTTLPHEVSAEEAMTYGHLGGWNVRKLPLQTVTETGLTIPIPGMNAVVRDNPINKGQVDVLSRHGVGDGYTIIQNENHAGLLNALVDEGGAKFETAGALYGGRQVFISMKLPGHIRVGGVDQVENYIAAINSHDGSMAFTLMVTPVRIVCANTLNLAFQNKSNMFRIRHTSNAEKHLVRQAREALDFTFDYIEGFQEEADQLIDTTMTQMQFEELMTEAFGVDEDASKTVQARSEDKIEDLVSLFVEAGTQDGIRDTAWAGLMALTEWSDHFSPTRSKNEDEARAQRAILDPEFKNKARKLILSAV